MTDAGYQMAMEKDREIFRPAGNLVSMKKKACFLSKCGKNELDHAFNGVFL